MRGIRNWSPGIGDKILAGLVVLLVLLLGFDAVASDTQLSGDEASYQIIGFSADGRYLAYQTGGMHSGGPVYWSEIYFLDVIHNTWAAPPVSYTGDGEPTTWKDVKDEVRSRADSTLEVLKIVEGNVGRQYVSHLFSDTGVDPHRTRFFTGEKLTGGYFEEYDVILTETVDGSCDDFGSRVKLELAVTNIRSDEKNVLQKDQKVPASRGCPLSYRIADVYVYQTSIIVFLNVMTPGWEGRNMRYMCITGKLPREDG